MTCGDKTKNNCGKKIYAECTYYEGTLPEWSELDNCKTVEETTEELYTKLTELIEILDFSETTSACESLTIKEEGGKVTLKSYLETLLEVAEGIKCGEITIKEDVDISKWNLDLADCISEPCDTPITKLSVLIQTMITKMCECCLSEGGVAEIIFGANAPVESPSVENPQRVYLRANGQLYVWFTTGTPGWLEIGVVDIDFNKGQFATDGDLVDQGAYIRKVTPATDIPAKSFVFTPEFVNGILTQITTVAGFDNTGSIANGAGAYQRRWDGMVDFRGFVRAEGGFLSEGDLPLPTYRISALEGQVTPTGSVNRLIRIPGYVYINDAAASKEIYHVEYIISAVGNAALDYAAGGLYVRMIDPQYDIDLIAKTGGASDTWNEAYFFLDPIKYFL